MGPTIAIYMIYTVQMKNVIPLISYLIKKQWGNVLLLKLIIVMLVKINKR